MGEAMDYPVGAVKQDPDTKITAVRSDQPADGPFAWFVFVPFNMRGGHWATLGEVADLPDTP